MKKFCFAALLWSSSCSYAVSGITSKSSACDHNLITSPSTAEELRQALQEQSGHGAIEKLRPKLPSYVDTAIRIAPSLDAKDALALLMTLATRSFRPEDYGKCIAVCRYIVANYDNNLSVDQWVQVQSILSSTLLLTGRYEEFLKITRSLLAPNRQGRFTLTIFIDHLFWAVEDFIAGKLPEKLHTELKLMALALLIHRPYIQSNIDVDHTAYRLFEILNLTSAHSDLHGVDSLLRIFALNMNESSYARLHNLLIVMKSPGDYPNYKDLIETYLQKLEYPEYRLECLRKVVLRLLDLGLWKESESFLGQARTLDPSAWFLKPYKWKINLEVGQDETIMNDLVTQLSFAKKYSDEKKAIESLEKLAAATAALSFAVPALVEGRIGNPRVKRAIKQAVRKLQALMSSEERENIMEFATYQLSPNYPEPNLLALEDYVSETLAQVESLLHKKGGVAKSSYSSAFADAK